MENILLGITAHESEMEFAPATFVVSPIQHPYTLDTFSREIPKNKALIVALAKQFMKHPNGETVVAPDDYLHTLVFLTSVGRLRSAIFQSTVRGLGYYVYSLDCYVSGDINDFMRDTKENYFHITASKDILPSLILKEQVSSQYLCKSVNIKANHLIEESS